MADDDLQLRVPIPHDYLRNYAVQTSIDSQRVQHSKNLTEFRGYVVSRGFDIENVVSDIITHVMFLNRPPYEKETENEYLTFQHCRHFFQKGLLVDRAFGFRRKIEFIRNLLSWFPETLKLDIILPNVELDAAARWRNAFAHDRIELMITSTNSVMPILKETSGRNCKEVELTVGQLEEVAKAMETCYSACSKLAEKLCTRYGDARPR